ncbi:serine hydrolase [Tistrella bauzanensis]|nr:serine hydrolase [Tistrella bauzanensis]
MGRPSVAEERREAILSAFEACVVRKGLAETTLADVAAEAGQPRPLVRYFIGNRDAMVGCLIDRLLARGEAQLALVREGAAAGTPDDLADLLFNRIFADKTTNMVIMDLWHLSLRDEALRVRLGTIYRRLVDHVAQAIARDMAPSGTAPAFDTAFAAVSLAFGTSFFNRLGLTPIDPERLRDRIAGMLSPAPPSPLRPTMPAKDQHMTDQPTAAIEDFKLFSGAPQHETFPRLKDRLPATTMVPAATPFVFPEGPAVTLPAAHEFDGEARSFEGFFADTDTAALLVLKDGMVRHERYALTGGRDVQWISWSVAKSFVSAMVGIAIAEGHIGGVDEPISDYVPVMPGSAYDGVSIRHVLQMSSGARWNEDYNDNQSDVHRLGTAMSGDGSLDRFVAEMVAENPPGTICRYNSGDTQALGALLIRATGRSITDYMQEKLVEPLGMTHAGHWLIDPAGVEMAFAGLNLTARDFARLGELYRNGGVWQGRQIVPADWVRASVTVTAPHLAPGRPHIASGTSGHGYGYQWWLPAGNRGEFSATGIYNQFVYVDPSRGVTIVKLSANRRYGTSMDEATNRGMETIAWLRAIAASLD